MIRHKNSQKQLISELVDNAIMHRVTHDNIPAPGQIIARLSQADRDILSKLTSNDLVDVRWPRPDGLNLERLPYNHKYKR